MPNFTFRQWVAGAGVLLLLGLGAWYFWPAGPVVSQLDRRFDQMLGAMEKSGEESQFVQIGVAREVQGFFASDVRLDVGPPVGQIDGRSEIQRAVIGGRAQAETLSFSTLNRQAEVSEDEQEATYEVTVRGSARVGGQRRADSLRIRIDWVRQNDEWLIRSIDLLEYLEE
ncbi:MAG: nuclear transport factor 2 family protein [Opitutales bacterium]|nr:nuclear transport factor 2 family protein [Opitutales bacterium]MCH8541378.1 nuclear transport factor 2 family protein [Opitutales bacterium]